MKAKPTIPEVVDKQAGVLGPIPFTKAENAPSYEEHPIFYMINGYENEAREILKACGYPLISGALIAELRWSKERRIRDLVSMLTHFKDVRIHIRMNNPAEAAFSMAEGLRAALQARIRPMEKSIDIGAARRKKQIETRSKRQFWHGQSSDQLSKRNQKIIEHFKRTHLSRSGFAKKHAAKYGLKSRQVMDILKMAVCSLPG